MRRRGSIPSHAANRKRQQRVWSDNIVLVPASQLKAIKEWQRKANQLPDGSALLVLPAGNSRMEVIARDIRLLLNREGRETVGQNRIPARAIAAAGR